MGFDPISAALEFVGLDTATTAAATTAAATASSATGIAGASSLAAATLPEIAGISTASVPIAATVPGWLGTAALGATALSGVTGAIGAINSSQAQANSARYNEEVAQINAAQAKQNATLAGQSASEQAAQASLKSRAEVGALLANQAAAGIDVNKGSAVDVRSSAKELGELDALTVRSNATREAYGYRVQGTNFQNESTLDEYEAKNDQTAGVINAASTLLGSAGTAATNFAIYQMAGGFSG